MVWTRWGGSTAKATGTLGALNCDPDSARGSYSYSDATITLSAIRTCGGRRQYTRANLQSNERSAADEPIPSSSPDCAQAQRGSESERSATAATQDCGDTTQGGGYFVGAIQAANVSCDEARFAVAGLHGMDPQTVEPVDGDSSVTPVFDSDGHTERVEYEYDGESRILQYSTVSTGQEAGRSELSDGERSMVWESAA